MMSADNQFKPPVTVKSGQIQFAEACHPPLVAGEYRIGTSQFIADPEKKDIPWNSDPYASELVFSVDAPRFTLNPAEIHSVYPPVNEVGRFDNALPHVVFARRTLPWERTLDGLPPELGKAFWPWMGLILLKEDELAILDDAGRETGESHQVRSLPVLPPKAEPDKPVKAQKDSLLVALDKNVLVPDIGQTGAGSDQASTARSKKWEKEKLRYEAASCLCIDLPAGLFKAVAPRKNELLLLAHVRQVDTGDKEVFGINDKGWFSLVIGNRVPQAGSHWALLVSLEGHQDRLEDKWEPAADQLIRLAVLCSWKFTCKGSNDFKAWMKQLNVGNEAQNGEENQLPDPWLHLPHQEYTDSYGNNEKLEEEDIADIVNGAYARGYTALNHAMRQGEKTVSWYRGPLVPLYYDQPRRIRKPFANADELLRFDPRTGLFDVTFAAAWQLGRLLALQNKGFAMALNRTRSELRAKAARQLLRKELDLKAGDVTGEVMEDRVAEQIGNKLMDVLSVPPDDRQS